MVDNAVDNMDVDSSALPPGIIQSSAARVTVPESSPNSPGRKHDIKKATREAETPNPSLLDDGAQSYTSERIIDLETKSGTPGAKALQLPG